MKILIIIFTLLVTAKTDDSHLKLNTKNLYLPPVTKSGHKQDVGYTISKPGYIPNPPRLIIPHSSLNTLFVDSPLQWQLFTPADSDPMQQAGSDNVMYSTAPNSVFHEQMNVQSQGSTFNSPHTKPIAMDSEHGHTANFASNGLLRSKNPESVYHTRKRDRTDYSINYHSIKSSKLYGQDQKQNTEDNNNNEQHYLNKEKYQRRHLNKRKKYGDIVDKMTQYKHNTKSLRNQAEIHQNKHNERKNVKGNAKKTGSHDSIKRDNEEKYSDPYQSIKLNDNRNNSPDKQHKYYKNKNNKSRTVYGLNGPKYLDDNIIVKFQNYENQKDETSLKYRSYYNGVQNGNIFDKIQNHREFDERENLQYLRSHAHNKHNNYQRTIEDHSKLRAQKKRFNFINGKIADDQASQLIHLPQNLKGKTKDINPIDDHKNLGIGVVEPSKQHENDERALYLIVNHDMPKSKVGIQTADNLEAYNVEKSRHNTTSDRLVISPSTLKINKFNKNNLKLPLKKQKASFSADHIKSEYYPSDPAPELIYKSGDEIDFSETKLIDYDDNSRPLDRYKFTGKRGRQREAHDSRSETDLREDGYHYSKPSISFNF